MLHILMVTDLNFSHFDPRPHKILRILNLKHQKLLPSNGKLLGNPRCEQKCDMTVYLTFGKTNELSKYRERFIWIEKRVYFQYLLIFI